jgi:hypothetical protein
MSKPPQDAPPCPRADILLKRLRETRTRVIDLQSDTDMLARVRRLHARVVALDEATRVAHDPGPAHHAHRAAPAYEPDPPHDPAPEI